MTNQEKDIIRTLTYHLKDIYRNKGKKEAIRYIDYTIFLRKKLDYSNELMEKLYFIRNYIDKVAFQEVNKNERCRRKNFKITI